MAIPVFLIATFFVLYVLFGYPLLLGWASSRWPRPVRKSFTPRTVSILLAVRNGAAFLQAKLDNLLSLDYPPELIEILVLNDGSSDDTAPIADRYAARHSSLHVLHLPAGGKCAALNVGLARATGEILFFTDVRQILEPKALQELVSCFGDPDIGCVSGELMIRSGDNLEQEQIGLYWRYEKWIRYHQSLIDSVIGATGAIYAQRRALAQPLPVDALLDDVHQPLNAFFADYRIIFDPSARAYDIPTNLSGEFRRKVRTLAGNYQIFAAFPGLFSRRNRMLWHFLSHKFARLILPFALLLIAAISFWLPAPLNWLALLAQGAFYALALLDPIIPTSIPLKRLSSPIRAFSVLMAATLLASSILFRPAKTFWR
jgi:poly-beta-1,6-N-acetyl-D-glucosamine synthase